MADGYGLALAAAVALIAVIFEMVRRRYVRGRFAVIWIAVALLTLALAMAPGLLDWAAEVTGVHVPLNLLFFVGFVGLLMILIQLTAAFGRLEQNMRRMAEDVAILTAAQERETLDEPKGSSLPDGR